MRFSGNQARPRQLEKHIRILLHILRFGYVDKISTMRLLDLAESATAATLKAMCELGLIARLIGHGTSCWLYRLTPAGGRCVNGYRDAYDEGIKALTSPTDIGVHYSAHNLVAQRYSAKWSLITHGRGQVLAPRQIRAHGLEVAGFAGDRAGWKVPDVMLIRPTTVEEREQFGKDEYRIAVEVQQSSEAPSTRAYKLWQYYGALELNQIDEFHYCSTFDRLRLAYQRHWLEDLEERQYNIEKHKWVRPEDPRTVESDDALLDRGKFILLRHDPFAVGLYPSPASLYRDEPDDGDDDK